MKHIIDPWIFYKINLVSNLKSFLMILILICVGVFIYSYFTEEDEYYDEVSEDKDADAASFDIDETVDTNDEE